MCMEELWQPVFSADAMLGEKTLVRPHLQLHSVLHEWLRASEQQSGSQRVIARIVCAAVFEEDMGFRLPGLGRGGACESSVLVAAAETTQVYGLGDSDKSDQGHAHFS